MTDYKPKHDDPMDPIRMDSGWYEDRDLSQPGEERDIPGAWLGWLLLAGIVFWGGLALLAVLWFAGG